MARGTQTDDLTPRVERIETRLDHLTEEVRTLRDEMAAEFRGVREENVDLRREMAAEFRSVRAELNALHGRLAMIGFGLVGSVLASAVAVILAISGAQ